MMAIAKVEMSELGEAVITLEDGSQIKITCSDNRYHGKHFTIRALDHRFVIHSAGAVNVVELEIRRLGT